MATDTILVPGNGTGTLSVQLHGPDVTDVEAVLAEIDTGGAGDTTATLIATSPTGLDVAAVPQGSPVSGGGTGRATWALRLAEDGAAAAAALAMTDGFQTIAPVSEIFVDGNMALDNLGAGEARIRAIIPAPPPQPSLLLAFYNVLSPQDGLVPGSFPVTVGVSNGNRPGVTGGQARFQFNGGAFRMVVRGEIWNNTLSTIDAKVSVDTSIGPGVPELPVETNALAVPPGGTGTLPPIYLDIHPVGLSVAWLDYGTTISGGGVSITGVQLIGDIEFRPI